MSYLERAKKAGAKKRLGQNFLIDEKVLEVILDTSNITRNDTVVEIGAGLGFVTERLVKLAKKVYAVELDENMVKELSKIKADNLEILHQDVLKTDFSQFGENIKVTANIPYYITSPILMHLLGEIDDLDNKNRNAISQIVLTVQYEVAKRLTADENSPSKEYGMLSVAAKFWSDTEFIRKVPAKSFFPVPKVDSALIKLTVKKKPLLTLKDYTFFKKVLRGCFSSRRKNIKNSLINTGFAKNAVEKTLNDLNIDKNLRAEALSVSLTGLLSETLKENL